MNKSNTEGIGFGLVISKMIVQKFDGSIGFKSEPDLGSEFVFSFAIKEKSDKSLPSSTPKTLMIQQSEAQILPNSELNSMRIFEHQTMKESG